MKILGALLLLSALSASPALAAWDFSVIKDETVTARVRIASNLGFVNSLSRALVNEELASPSKMVIRELTITIQLAKWVNDEVCTLSKPYSTMIESGSATYYFADDPSEVMGLGVGSVMIQDPCQLGSRVTTKTRRWIPKT